MKSLFSRPASPFRKFALAIGAFCAAGSARADISFETIHTFVPASDGNVPYAELAEGADGRFYGTTTTDGPQAHGTVYSLKSNGTGFTVLSGFPGTNGGSRPEGAVIQARDGNFYGTTYAGGANGFGSLYQVTPAGTLTLLTSFTNGDPGSNPGGALLEGVDGLLYGTAGFGGLDDFGTIFRAAVPAGAASTFSTFEGGLDGDGPQSDLIQARDGNFYGTTSSGGTSGAGTFFRLTPDGVRMILFNFTNGTDGSLPLRGVIQGTDGNFYGITQNGGQGAGGVVYRLEVSAAAVTLTPLAPLNAVPGTAFTSYGRLLQASDGNFYGTSNLGGTSGVGTVFRVTPGGALTVLYSFTGGTDGGNPDSGLTQGSDGKLYGTTAGQNSSDGTIYRIDIGLAAPGPRVDLFSPASAQAGDTIQLQGDHLVGTTVINFAGANGTSVPAASFSVASMTSLAAVVPAGAASGVITVKANGQSAATPTALTIDGGSTPPPQGTTVTLTAPDAVASYMGNNNAHFKIARQSSDLSAALTVVFKVRGNSTAVRGTDYNLVAQGQTLAPITDSITIPAGRKGIRLRVVPITTTATSRPDQTVILRLQAGADYTVGSLKNAAVSIAGYGE